MATVSEPAAAFEGHPFIVEAGVSLGGQAVKDGINVYRFANRIPLLFEAGNDVVTQVGTLGVCLLDPTSHFLTPSGVRALEHPNTNRW